MLFIHAKVYLTWLYSGKPVCTLIYVVTRSFCQRFIQYMCTVSAELTQVSEVKSHFSQQSLVRFLHFKLSVRVFVAEMTMKLQFSISPSSTHVRCWIQNLVWSQHVFAVKDLKLHNCILYGYSCVFVDIITNSSSYNCKLTYMITLVMIISRLYHMLIWIHKYIQTRRKQKLCCTFLHTHTVWQYPSLSIYIYT